MDSIQQELTQLCCFWLTGAGQAFTEAAKLFQEKLESRHEAATNFSEAAQVYKKVNPNGEMAGLCNF